MNATVRLLLRKLFFILAGVFFVAFFLQIDRVLVEKAKQENARTPGPVVSEKVEKARQENARTPEPVVLEKNLVGNKSVNQDNGRMDHEDNIPKEEAPSPTKASSPILLTLFTSFREQDSQRTRMFALSLYNWVLLGDDVQPVLFVSQQAKETSSFWQIAASSKRWHVLRVPATNKYGTPIINAMFKEVYSRYDSHFYGYANGDVLFSNDILQTLLAVKAFVQNGDSPGRPLPAPYVVGQRRSWNLKLRETAKSAMFWTKDSVVKHVQKMPLDDGCNIDYFFMTKDYPWDKIPEMVIGRSYYDVYLLMIAMYHNLTTVDATSTLGPLHLRGQGVQFTHFTARNQDEAINFFNIERYNPVPYYEACTESCLYKTFNNKGAVGFQANQKVAHIGSSLNSTSREMVRKQLYNFQHNITRTLTQVPWHLNDLHITKINF